MAATTKLNFTGSSDVHQAWSRMFQTKFVPNTSNRSWSFTKVEAAAILYFENGISQHFGMLRISI